MGKRGRPIKEHADWFSHQSGLRNDAKVRALRATFGSQGYGIFIMVWEKLAGSPNFKFNYSSHVDKAILSGDFIEPIEILDKVIGFMEEFGLIQRYEDGSVYSPALLVELDELIKNRKADAERKSKISDDEIIHPEKGIIHPEKSDFQSESTHSNSNSNSINISIDKVKPMYPKGFVQEQFDRCWIAFGKKGTKARAFTYWQKHSQTDREAIENKIPAYVASRPDKTFRKNFDGWINPVNRMWEDEIIQTSDNKIKVGEPNQRGHSKGKF